MLLASATGTTLDRTRGHLAVRAADCDFASAEKVSFSVNIADEKSVHFYIVNGGPGMTATSTDQSGVFADMNLPTSAPGKLAVVAATSVADGGKSMGSLALIIRPGTITVAGLFPPQP